MTKDVLIVDDEKEYLDTIHHIIKPKRQNFNLISYTDFYDALDFVIKRRRRIYACFVDMKPILVMPDKCTKEDKQLLEVPENIFYAVASKGWDGNFYFFSTNKSTHDEEVLRRTGAKYFDKSDILKQFGKILV